MGACDKLHADGVSQKSKAAKKGAQDKMKLVKEHKATLKRIEEEFAKELAQQGGAHHSASLMLIAKHGSQTITPPSLRPCPGPPRTATMTARSHGSDDGQARDIVTKSNLTWPNHLQKLI